MIKWRDVYPYLKNKTSQPVCIAVAGACFNLAKTYANSDSVDYLTDVKNRAVAGLDKKKLSDDLSAVAIIRVRESDAKAREVAHIALHMVEVALATNYVSAAGHAARCIDALGKVDEALAQSICSEYLYG